MAICVFFVTGCGGNAPPELLSGSWGRSETACRAGIVARFDADAVRLFGSDRAVVLLERPRYTLDPSGRVRVRFDLPQVPGGAPAGAGEGLIVLEGADEGRLRVVSRRFVDRLSGATSARLDLAGDPLAETLALVRCPGGRLGPARDAGLRGRSE